MGQWRRVRTPRSFFMINTGAICFGLIFLATGVVSMVGHPVGMTVWVVSLLLLLGAVFRSRRMGVYYGELGVRLCNFFRTWVVPWESVEGFEDRTVPHNTWVLGSSAPSRGVWIVCEGGERISTPLMYQTAQFLHDPAVDPPTSRNHWVWSQAECRAAQDELERALRAARRALAEEG